MYKILEKINSGIHGDVFLIEDEENKKMVAKHVPMKNGLYQCIQETTILSNIKHKNIIEIKDIVVLDKGYAVIEELGLCDLKIWRENIIDISSKKDELKKIMYGCLSGLDFIHKNKFIHCDIKPNNILYFGDGDVKICDFSVSRINNDINISNRYLYNSYYRSPELWNLSYFNEKIDIWAMGCVFYEIILNRKYNEKNKENDINPFFKENFCEFFDIINKMLIKDYKMRPSCEDLLNENIFSQFHNGHTFCKGINKKIYDIEVINYSEKNIREKISQNMINTLKNMKVVINGNVISVCLKITCDSFRFINDIDSNFSNKIYNNIIEKLNFNLFSE